MLGFLVDQTLGYPEVGGTDEERVECLSALLRRSEHFGLLKICNASGDCRDILENRDAKELKRSSAKFGINLPYSKNTTVMGDGPSVGWSTSFFCKPQEKELPLVKWHQFEAYKLERRQNSLRFAERVLWEKKCQGMWEFGWLTQPRYLHVLEHCDYQTRRRLGRSSRVPCDMVTKSALETFSWEEVV
ncbi:hypothetical protein P691DRAFT_782548 [Macrolepiota fuliginosa MF-IS2]|uniref:Uncharacterized protein n=1 Tax=Macrolepiota fuliginosa MF-IS2 TaxID=1400762 RepID=A0A9P5XD38_9AGAR|nr:hypothetical protein P691DRAFT_782548 [Macrolepiota fuliginosa MF-IS2]